MKMASPFSDGNGHETRGRDGQTLSGGHHEIILHDDDDGKTHGPSDELLYQLPDLNHEINCQA